MISTTQSGKNAELIAEKFYLNKGFRLVERNFRWARGEVDLILENGSLLLLVEVKYRKQDWEHHAWSPLWRDKLRRLRASIPLVLDRYPQFHEREKGIDVVFVTQGRVEEVFETV